MEKGCEAVESKTQLAKLIELTNDKAKYDAQVKKIPPSVFMRLILITRISQIPQNKYSRKNPGNVIRF